MVIGVDKNQFAGKHGRSNAKKHRQMRECGAELLPLPLPFGDYCLVTEEVQRVVDEKGTKLKKKDLESVIKLSIDTKKDLQELFANVRSQQHERFKRELLKPIKNNAQLIILCEHGEDVQCLEDVYFFYQPEMQRFRWVTETIAGRTVKTKIPHTQMEMKGSSLYRSLNTIKTRYNVQFEFCTRNNSGKRIFEILGGTYDEGRD